MRQKFKIFSHKFISILLICIFVVNFTPVAFASHAPVYGNEAIRLNRLGLFLGTGNGFELNKPCDRLQGAAMFIRLVGEEEAALSHYKDFPFTDVTQTWAIPYVGQMYAQGYSNGKSDDLYGTGAMTGDEFGSYILRALGYSEAAGDFVWSASLDKLVSLGILSLRDFAIIDKGVFYRDYAAKLAASALDASLKDSEMTLYELLFEKGAITDYSTLIPPPVATGTVVRSYEDMQMVFQRMHANLQYSVTLNTEGLYLQDVKDWINLITNTASADVYGWRIVSTFSTDKNYPTKVSIKWYYSDGYEVAHAYLYPDSDIQLSDKNMEIKEVVDAFIRNEIIFGMTDEEKIKAVHDYLVRTTRYDTDLDTDSSDTSSDSYKAYGVLVNHLGVCDGYAKAFNLFMDIFGIESERVVGSSKRGTVSVNHAWNRVYLDNEHLNLDITWDDPVPDGGNRILYDYYLISDDEMRKDHTWDASQFDVKYY